MSYIKSYCHIVPGSVWLNGKKTFQIKQKPFMMNDFISAIYSHSGIDYRKFYKMDALSKLGFLASEILLAGSDREQPKHDMGIVLINRSSSLEADINYQKTIQDKENFFPSPAEFVYTLPNIVTGEIAIRNKIYGETAFYSCSAFSPATIHPLIEDTLKYAGIKCALAGWIDVDVYRNYLNCCLMLCSSKMENKRNSHLSAGLENIYAGKNILLTEDNLCEIFYYKKIIYY